MGTPEAWTDGHDQGLACEDDVLALVNLFFPSRTPHVPFGRGHDCAELVAFGSTLALSTDMFWEDTHFRRSYFTPEEAGAKALITAVSDLAAAGAAPLGFSLGLLLPEGLSRAALSGVLQGMARKAHEYGMTLSGGDLARGDRLGFSVTVWGKPVEDAPFLRRDQPEPGDTLFLIGACGLARVGLWALEQEGRAAMTEWPKACAAHLKPEALLRQGQQLALLAREASRSGSPARISLMDVSDGLARDLPRLLGGFGAELAFDPALVPAETARAASSLGFSPEELFFLGGEDYALLGSCPQSLWPRISALIPEARFLGRVCRENVIAHNGKTLNLRGFDHFSPVPIGKERALPAVAEASAAIIRCCREAWEAGLMAGFNGNASGRLASPAQGRCACLITRSGAAKARLGSADFALLALPDGQHLHGPEPSTESAAHLGLYAACPDTTIILHTHPPCLLALSLVLPPEKRLDLPLPEADNYRTRIAWTPFFPPGSPELGQAVAEAAKTHPAVWMERHGLVVHGPDPAFCLSLSEELEQLARVQLETLAAASKS
ncbi:MAG: class II aldolase/adducin family protein [Desulfovibrionaceae bacterium]|nr:class II aldolase/adducin family protein [Desulfovibrionaceae bacterium]